MGQDMLAEAPPFRRQPPLENRVYLLGQRVEVWLWGGALMRGGSLALGSGKCASPFGPLHTRRGSAGCRGWR